MSATAALSNRAEDLSAGSESPPPGWPAHVLAHEAIVSGWNDEFLLIRSSSGAVRRFELASVPLPSNADVGGPFSRHSRLGDFPHWMETTRAYAALALHDTSGHDAADRVSNALNHLFRFFAWCVRRRVYRLDALTRADLKALESDLRPRGWFSALPLDEWMRAVVDLARADAELRDALVRRVRGARMFSPRALSEAIGCVISGRELPKWLHPVLAELCPDATDRWRRDMSKDSAGWSQSSFKTCFTALRRLSRLEGGVDRLSFDPFPNTRTAARASGAPADGRTPNLPLEQAAQLLSTSLGWIYDKADGVEALLHAWGRARQDTSAAGSGSVEHVTQALNKAYADIAPRYGLPQGPLGTTKKPAGGTSMVELVHRIQTAAVVLIGINQARRKNEVIGESSRPWGVYFGCVTRSDPFIEAFQIDMYIEKTWRTWRTLSANRITADAIAVLERIRRAMPGLEDCDPDAELGVRRTQKLFVFPCDGPDGSFRCARYAFGFHSGSLFDEAGLDRRWRRTHQFRRLFAMLYMYRYDHPRLQALSQFLSHLDLDCTRTYVTDPAMVEESERLERLYQRKRDDSPTEELKEARGEYSDHQIQAMLTAPGGGGTLTRRVRKWVKRLIDKVELDTVDLDAASTFVKERFAARGHSPIPYPHGICWASDRHATRAGCGGDGKLARELAGIKTCSACPFHSTSVAFLENVQRDIHTLEAQRSAAISPVEARHIDGEIGALEDLIQLERTLISRSVAPLSNGVPA